MTTSIRETALQMSKAISEPAVQMTTSILKQPGTIKTKQQLLTKEVFSPQITKFGRERLIPIYTDETWSFDLLGKSSLSK